MKGPGGAPTPPAVADTWVRGDDVVKRTCSVPGCERDVATAGMCHTHYERTRRHGDPGPPHLLRDRRQSPEERFWSKVDRNGPVPEHRPDLGPCWLWTGGTSHGYGAFDRRQFGTGSAHRIAYMLVVGPIPERTEPDHLCRVKLCVNPAHLEPVPHLDNVRRGERPVANKGACVHGHPYDPNFRRSSTGAYLCPVCDHERRL